MPDSFLHKRNDFRALVATVADSKKINHAALVEKDYWIMHAVYGLKQLGLTFELNGGTSLSKALGSFSDSLLKTRRSASNLKPSIQDCTALLSRPDSFGQNPRPHSARPRSSLGFSESKLFAPSCLREAPLR